MKSEPLLSWGNYPHIPQIPEACFWGDDIGSLLDQAKERHGSTLAFGSGLSYGDSCLAATDRVLDMRPLDRFLGADWESGVVVAESGVTFEAILKIAIPRGWFVPVTPGTKYITLGGAIANDVHGKNHHRRGTFGCHVRRLSLIRSDTGRLTCSLGENEELFRATIGGLGLTGIIEWAEVQLVPISSTNIVSVQQRFSNLEEFFCLSDDLDEQHEFCVSWIDCLAKGGNAGRGVYMAGDFCSEGPLEIEGARKITFPVTPPFSLVNTISLRIFNELYWRKAPPRGRRSIVGYDPFFYPLDAILKWNRIYGPRGFQQYQALIPEAESRYGIKALLETISRSGTGSFLAVLKRCGSIASPGLLSFPMSGTTLALDFPQDTRLSSELFPRLDSIVREAGGRLYPAKDAHMSGDTFRRSFPDWCKIEAVRDPVLMSRFWQRVVR